MIRTQTAADFWAGYRVEKDAIRKKYTGRLRGTPKNSDAYKQAFAERAAEFDALLLSYMKNVPKGAQLRAHHYRTR